MSDKINLASFEKITKTDFINNISNFTTLNYYYCKIQENTDFLQYFFRRGLGCETRENITIKTSATKISFYFDNDNTNLYLTNCDFYKFDDFLMVHNKNMNCIMIYEKI